MRKKFNHNLLVLARESRGLTQLELSKKVKVDQSAISKIENGEFEPMPSLLKSLSVVLGYPRHFFYSEGEMYSADAIYYRKRASLSKKSVMMLDANLHFRRLQIQQLLKSVELNRNYPFFDVDEYGSPENIARHVRALWRIPKGTIPNVTEVLEKAGIIIVNLKYNDDKFDGMTFLTEDGQPMIYNNCEKSWDRQRFNLAHELGHLIMHISTPPTADRDVEKEANRFAGEFLMPEIEIKPYLLPTLNFSKLIELKRYWKVSMAALIVRAKELRKISQSKYESLMVQLSAAGYRKREPDLGLQPESPQLLKQIMKSYLNDLNYSYEELCELLFMNDEDELKDFFIDKSPSKLKVAM